jgi:serine/threonine-protein kinase RsbW
MSVLNKKMLIRSELTAARSVEDRLLEEAARCGYGDAALFAIKLALEEALNNAIKHGNRMDPNRAVQVQFSVDGDRTEISIFDEGAGFDPSQVPDPTADENLEKPCGRGIMLMRAYMDEVRYNPRGNQVYMMKRKT